MSVKPAAATPAAAATLLLFRDRPGGGPEILLMRRHMKSKFAAGDFAFPGGKLTADDNPDDAAAWCTGIDARAADPPPLEYWIGAVRETFEEVGVLLATRDGTVADIGAPRFARYRRACQTDNRAFWTMVEGEDLRLATNRLTYFAHWITPEDQPLRFDTRFFAALLPEGQRPALDEREVTEIRWLTPTAALAAVAAGEMTMRPVTARNLRLFEGAASAAEAIARVEGRPVETVRPRVVVEDGRRRVLVPGDPGY